MKSYWQFHDVINVFHTVDLVLLEFVALQMFGSVSHGIVSITRLSTFIIIPLLILLYIKLIQ